MRRGGGARGSWPFILLLQSIGSAAVGLTLNALQEQLDVARNCNTYIEATSLISRVLAHTQPSLVPLARILAANPTQLKTRLLSTNSSITALPPGHNFSSNGTYVLSFQCLDGVGGGGGEGEGGSCQPLDLDLCTLSVCSTKCTSSLHPGLRILARDCCGLDSDAVCRQATDRGRHMLILFNVVCAVACLVLIPLVCRARRSQHESRGWALMELFLVGAATLYSILLLDWVPPPLDQYGCGVAEALRHIGFALFYGSIVIKIYRNLEEYRVRKAQHVSVREEDMLKYLGCMVALTVTGVVGWLAGESPIWRCLWSGAGAWGDVEVWRTSWPQCTLSGWAVIAHCYELVFLVYGATLCYKARNSDWLERWQFTVAVCLEAIVTLVANLIRYSIRASGNSDTLFTVTFVQLQLTVSVNIVIIIAPKFYMVSGESSRRTLALGGQSGRAHPSLAKLRDNILNGTIDFAEVPIIDMNPEDIRAELKRVYTQLRMYKLKNLYQDNPHISKRKGGGKRWSDKPKPPRRISVPSCSPQTTKAKIEEEEKSDLTVESAPHNVLLSTSCQLQLESNSSVRV